MLSAKELSSFNDDQDIHLNEDALEKLGGLSALEKKLKTNFKKGLSGDAKDIANRITLYGKNEFPVPESQTWLELFIASFEDATLIVLIVSAVVSFAVGIIEDPAKGWIEGAAILFAVLLVAVVTATNDYNKESQFRKLNAVKDDVEVGVLRAGQAVTVDVKALVVGDILILNAGDRVPTDGLLVDGSDVTCNESALTGESDDKKKAIASSQDGGDMFMLSGSSLATGYAHVLVVAVGEQSRWGRTKAKLAAESVDTPLQEKLDTLAGQIGNLGMVSAGATFLAMMVLWFMYPENRDPSLNVWEFALKAFIMAVTIVVVAVPEGLPLAVTLSLAYSTQKMMKDNNLIRVLAACETMGNATNICSDKTGTLTQNRMTVVAGWVAGDYYADAPPTSSDLPPKIVEYIAEGVSVNSTANLIRSMGDEWPIVNGSKTEGALLMMLEMQLLQDYKPLRTRFDASRGDKLITFSSARKRMSVVLADGMHGGAKSGVCYTKGAAEIVVGLSTKYIDAQGKEKDITAAVRKELLDAIADMAKNALRTIAIAHRVVSTLTGDEDAEQLETELTIDAVFGIKDPLRPDVKAAVEQCQEAGIFVRMVTGDNIDTAKAIARECGILTEGGLAMEGPVFRKLTPEQLDAVLPNLQVLARSSPDDKHTLVTRLNGSALPDSPESWLVAHPDGDFSRDKDLLLPGYREEWEAAREHQGGVGEVVGVTGDGTNDGPALKAADVGLSMGLTGTDVAKEASDIVILDDNFSSIVKSVMWGRSVFDNIRKFLQFQLTVNVVALTLTFVSAVTGSEPPLNAVMMLWVNLIMDTMGALALGTEPPSPKLLNRRPYKRNASLISRKMYRNITIQFIFQMGLLCYLLLIGAPHFGVVEGSKEHITVIFNTFVYCQVFNEINARSIGDDMNVFKGLANSPLFVAILVVTVVAQYGIVEFGGDFVRTASLTADQWYKCVLLGALSLPLGGLMRLVPVPDSANDFAVLSELMKANRKTVTESHKKRLAKQGNDGSSSSSSSVFSFSMLLWFLVVTLLPVLTLQHFNEHWQILSPDIDAQLQSVSSNILNALGAK
mmetsp:Transcript_14213/g.23654  ORF Transcript_14213/g.23654 Transcript_14213/m.23654 type:complete len:1068 (-) Transcript_14213:64-3267(-)